MQGYCVEDGEQHAEHDKQSSKAVLPVVRVNTPMSFAAAMNAAFSTQGRFVGAAGIRMVIKTSGGTFLRYDWFLSARRVFDCSITVWASPCQEVAKHLHCTLSLCSIGCCLFVVVVAELRCRVGLNLSEIFQDTLPSVDTSHGTIRTPSRPVKISYL